MDIMPSFDSSGSFQVTQEPNHMASCTLTLIWVKVFIITQPTPLTHNVNQQPSLSSTQDPNKGYLECHKCQCLAENNLTLIRWIRSLMAQNHCWAEPHKALGTQEKCWGTFPQERYKHQCCALSLPQTLKSQRKDLIIAHKMLFSPGLLHLAEHPKLQN